MSRHEPDERTRRIRAASEEIEARRRRILGLLRHGLPMRDAGRLAEALSSYSEARGRLDRVAREALPGWDYSPPAVAYHEVHGRQDPRQMARNYGAQAAILDAAVQMGLQTTVTHEDGGTRLEIRGPKDRLEELARYADEELDRAVQIEDHPDEEDAP
jgi:sugar phosphate isomerase/epimerase